MSRVRGCERRFTPPVGVVEGAVVSVFRVEPELAGQRLDVFVQQQLHRTSRTRAQAIIRASAYDESGRRLKANDRVKPEQLVLLWRAPWDETPVPLHVPVLYEDDHLLAACKPALLPVHPTARYHRNTLIRLLQDARPECRFLSLGHRLDRETSGVILVSKTRECDRALKRQIQAREQMEKTYVAITWGVPDPGDGAREFRYERGLELDPENPLRVKMRIHDGPSALHAVTRFAVLAIRDGAADRGVRTYGSRYAWIRCDLETGRQHQIRVHLASLGAPVVGDKLYGPDDGAFARAADRELTADDLLRLELPRHALHAARIALPHPVTGHPLRIEAPVPDDMSEFWRGLEGAADDNPLGNGTRSAETSSEPARHVSQRAQSPRGTLSRSS